MRHYSELKLDFLRPWAIVGKGPSFDLDRINDLSARGFGLCSINQAFEPCSVNFDMAVFYDWGTAEKFSDAGIARVSSFVTRTLRLGNGIKFYDALAHGKKIKDRCYFFDARDKLLYPECEPIFIEVSSSEAALTILARSGVKDVHFIGCDGSLLHHDLFEPRKSRRLLESQFITFAKLQKERGLNFYGLPAKYERYGGRLSHC